MFHFHCPFCEQSYEVEESMIGQIFSCTSCGKEIVVDHDIDYNNQTTNKVNVNVTKNAVHQNKCDYRFSSTDTTEYTKKKEKYEDNKKIIDTLRGQKTSKRLVQLDITSESILKYVKFIWNCILILIPILFIIWVINGCRIPQSWKSEATLEREERERKFGSEFEIKFAAQNAVRKRVKSPSSLKFMNDDKIQQASQNYKTKEAAIKLNIDPDRLWCAIGSFDAQNSFGATVRTTYYAIVEYSINGKYIVHYVLFE